MYYLCNNSITLGYICSMGFNKGLSNMNEKIKDLLDKHILPPAIFVERDPQDQHTVHVTYTVSREEMNALLEVVVQECTAICKEHKEMYASLSGSEVTFAAMTTAAGVCADDIAMRFGVEE